MLADKAQFSGKDSVNMLPENSTANTNDEKRNEIELQNRPHFTPKITPRNTPKPRPYG